MDPCYNLAGSETDHYSYEYKDARKVFIVIPAYFLSIDSTENWITTLARYIQIKKLRKTHVRNGTEKNNQITFTIEE